MTEILCRWLNEDVKLGRQIDGSSFAEEFSNGFLFGELLFKHGLQNDFQHFSKGRTSEAKLNNFMKLEPTFQLLDIPFNTNMIRDVMMGRPGVAAKLMYQLFVALNRKKQYQLSEQSLGTMKPLAKVKLEKMETGFFQERLKQQVPRQVDLNFEALVEKYQERKRHYEQLVATEKRAEEDQLMRDRKQACLRAQEKSHYEKKHTQLYSKLKPLPQTKADNNKPQATGTTAVPVSQKTAARRKAIADETIASIDEFEARIKHPVSSAGPRDRAHTLPTGSVGENATPAHSRSVTAPTENYLSEIKKRVQDGELARKEREKRRRKVLTDQMKAFHEQEEARHNKILVERLMRQCQQERRIATQLMHIRKEKDTIRNNRIFQQKQFEKQRLQEFEEALNLEAEHARKREVERKAKENHHLELRKRLLMEKAERNAKKNYSVCQQIVLQILDFATKMAEYRELTEKLVPAKIVRDWKVLFLSGKPLYDEPRPFSSNLPPSTEEMEAQSEASWFYASQDAKNDQQLLDDTDFQEYIKAENDWSPPEDLELPQKHNPILSHIVYRLIDLVDPPKPPPTPPDFPLFLLRACILGKPLSGKTTVLKGLHSLGIHVLSIEELSSIAIKVYLKEARGAKRNSTAFTLPGDDSTTASGRAAQPSSATPAIAIHPSGSSDSLLDSTAGSRSVADSSVGVAASAAAVVGVATADGTSLTMTEDGGGEGEGEGEGRSANTGTRSKDSITTPSQDTIQLSTLAAVGLQAYEAASSGQPLDDALMVRLITEELKGLPPGSAWVLEDFPRTLQQAKLLARGLTGEVEPTPQMNRDFILIDAQKNTQLTTFAASGLDVAVHCDASSETILQRAAQIEVYDQENSVDQLQQSLLSFEECWPNVKRWFLHYRNLVVVDANQPIESVTSKVFKCLNEIYNKAKQAEAMRKIGGPKTLIYSRKLSSLSMSHLSNASSPTHQPTAAAALQRTASVETLNKEAVEDPSSGTATSKKRMDVNHPLFIPANPNAEPGSSEWQYCKLPVPGKLAQGLAQLWPAVESSYCSSLKTVFQQLRSEREAVCRYFHARRKEFVDYLGRPDHKQEFMTQWQQSYNDIAAHLRHEAVMKAELHHRVDDLCEKLWDICDHRKNDAEAERRRIGENQWLEDHKGIITNHHITLMQAELDRFQDTALLLKDYYTAMQNNFPKKLQDFTVIPLVESVTMFVPSLPPPPPSPFERGKDQIFTVDQLLSLCKQLEGVAPSGFILKETLIDTLLSLGLKEFGEDRAPPMWCNVSKKQLEHLLDKVYGKDAMSVDWKVLLMCLGEPWLLNSAELLVEALKSFQSIDPSGFLSPEQILSVDTCITTSTKGASSEYNRTEGLKQVFFNAFVDNEKNVVDYRKMLLYFCSDTVSKRGLHKALSVAVGAPLPANKAGITDHTITLEDFLRVITHGREPSSVKTKDLFEVFLAESPENPNEAPLAAVLSNPVAMEYLDAQEHFTLHDLASILCPPQQELPDEQQ